MSEAKITVHLDGRTLVFSSQEDTVHVNVSTLRAEHMPPFVTLKPHTRFRVNVPLPSNDEALKSLEAANASLRKQLAERADAKAIHFDADGTPFWALVDRYKKANATLSAQVGNLTRELAEMHAQHDHHRTRDEYCQMLNSRIVELEGMLDRIAAAGRAEISVPIESQCADDV